MVLGVLTSQILTLAKSHAHLKGGPSPPHRLPWWLATSQATCTPCQEGRPPLGLVKASSGPEPCGSELPSPVSWPPHPLLGAAEPLWSHSWLSGLALLCACPMQAAQRPLIFAPSCVLWGLVLRRPSLLAAGAPLLTSFSIQQTQIRSDQISHSVVSDSLRPHESQHTRPPRPSPTPRVHSDSRPSSQ